MMMMVTVRTNTSGFSTRDDVSNANIVHFVLASLLYQIAVCIVLMAKKYNRYRKRTM